MIAAKRSILRMKTMNRIAQLGFASGLFALLSTSPLAAQNTTPPPDPSSSSQSASGQVLSGQSSLGDYARKVHKDPSVKTAPKVFDNDNLPKDDKLSVVGQPAESTDTASLDSSAKTDAAADGKDGKAAIAPQDDQTKKQAAAKVWQDRLTSQKNAIDLDSRELDVTQKEYQLRAAAMYADVGNRLRNSAEWDKQDADFKQQIADKQKALDDAKQKLDDLQEEARKAGVPAAVRE
jgi:hypothetical protein